MRGGQARSGPAPDPTSFRSTAAGSSGGWTRMTEPPETLPEWPLGSPTAEEAALWADLWTRPASSLWAQFGLIRDAAVYVRTALAFEREGHTNAALGGLVQRMADQLGLTIAGAARNKWMFPAPARRTPATVTTISGGRASARQSPRDSGPSAIAVLARWRDLGTRFPPDTRQYADATAELAARGIDLDPYEYLGGLDA